MWRLDMHVLILTFFHVLELIVLQNLRRTTINEEYEWIMKSFCAKTTNSSLCPLVQAQWRDYMYAQRTRRNWQLNTKCIEGAFFVADLHAIKTKCLLCSWFNEYSRYAVLLFYHLVAG